jgi:hypothetical protein
MRAASAAWAAEVKSVAVSAMRTAIEFSGIVQSFVEMSQVSIRNPRQLKNRILSKTLSDKTG